MRLRHLLAVPLLLATFTAQTRAGDLFISTGDPDGLMAMASRPSGNGKIETETADDFILGQTSQITNVSFTGLLTGGATAPTSARSWWRSTGSSRSTRPIPPAGMS